MRLDQRARRALALALGLALAGGAALLALAPPSFAAPIEVSGARIFMGGPGRVLESPDGLLIEAVGSVRIESLEGSIRIASIDVRPPPESGSLLLRSPASYPFSSARRSSGGAFQVVSGSVSRAPLTGRLVSSASVVLMQAPDFSNAALTPIGGDAVVTMAEPLSLASGSGGLTDIRSDSVVLTMVTNPEPGTGLLLAFGLGLLAGRRARRSRRPQS